MYSSFITSFCIISIVWCTVSYLLNLLACIYLCDAIDGALFEDQQEQGFEDVEQQQPFEEGKWPLMILPKGQEGMHRWGNSSVLLRFDMSLVKAAPSLGSVMTTLA